MRASEGTRMATITVYRYQIFDTHSQSYMLPRSPATRRAIDSAGGLIVPGSAEEVDIECVDDDGIVVRTASKGAQKPL
jgi:hypothetical protein